jgi:hypothetical protein
MQPPTREEVLAQLVKTESPRKKTRSPTKMIEDLFMELAPTPTKLVKEHKPRYSGKVLKVSFKTDVLGEEEVELALRGGGAELGALGRRLATRLPRLRPRRVLGGRRS